MSTFNVTCKVFPNGGRRGDMPYTVTVSGVKAFSCIAAGWQGKDQVKKECPGFVAVSKVEKVGG